MNLLLLLLLLGSSMAYNSEPTCGRTLSNLWLDVVAVIDNSKGMGQDGLTKIAATLSSVFGTGIKLGRDMMKPKTTRLGIITYSDETKIIADLNRIQNDKDVLNVVFGESMRVSSAEQSYLLNGLVEAEKMFVADPYRKGYKKVVIVFASNYKDTGKLNAVEQASHMKTDNIRIITVGFDQHGGGGFLKTLAEIASPGFNFTNNGGSIVKPVQEALMQANCFCPLGWAQYRDPNNHYYKTCLQQSNTPAIWKAAQLACQTLDKNAKNAFLINEYSRDKQEFVKRNFNITVPYFNGLQKENGIWKWDRPNGTALLELSGYTSWDHGYPRYGKDVVIDVVEDGETKWQTADPMVDRNYICEVAAFDTDSVCDFSRDIPCA